LMSSLLPLGGHYSSEAFHETSVHLSAWRHFRSCCRTRFSATYPYTMRDGVPRRSNPRLPLAPFAQRPYRSIGVPTGVRISSLLLGQRRDEFAAEVGDVRDHAAPDQVWGLRETTGYVSDDLLGGLEGPLAFGWCVQGCEPLGPPEGGGEPARHLWRGGSRYGLVGSRSETGRAEGERSADRVCRPPAQSDTQGYP
jgi:hypothetical protein